MRINKVHYNVDWRKFHVGWSFFVPCLHLPESTYRIRAVARRLGFKVAIKPVIEDGIKGLRVWRVK